MTVSVANKQKEINIDYCPFCGTRLEEVPSVVVDKFIRARKRKPGSED